MPYKVISECVDARTGKRFFPGDTFPEPTKDQAERLVKAKCIEEVSAAEARKAAIEAGIVINGLPILHMELDIDEYYEKFIIGGPGAFMVPARDYESFAGAVRRKLVLEIADRKGPAILKG